MSDHDDDHPTKRVQVRGYTRDVELKRYDLVCAFCTSQVTIYRYPGNAPRFCSEACQAEARLVADREQKAAKRKAKQAERAAAGVVVRRGRPRKP